MRKESVRWTALKNAEAAKLMFGRWLAAPLDTPQDIFRWVMEHQWPKSRAKIAQYLSTKGNPLLPLYLNLVKERLARIHDELAEMQPPQVLTIEREVTIDPGHFLRSQPFDVVALEFLARITRPLADIAERMDRLERRESAPDNSLKITLPVPVPVKPTVRPVVRIGCVGLFKDAFRHVVDKTAERIIGKAELIWLNGDSSAPSVPASVREIIATEHVRHGWSLPVIQAVGAAHYHVAHGVTGVTQKVFDICSRQ